MENKKLLIKKNPNFVSFFKKYKNLENIKDIFKLIIYACEKGLLEDLKYLMSLIKNKEDLSNILNKGLIKAIKNRKNNVIYFLLSLDIVNPRTANNSPIMFAAKTKNSQLLTFLLKHKKINIFASDFKIIGLVLKNNNLEQFYFIINKIAKKEEMESILSVVFIESCYMKDKYLMEYSIKHPLFKFCKKCENAFSQLIYKEEHDFIDLVLSNLASYNLIKERLSVFIRKSCENNNFHLYKILVNKYNGYPCGRQSANLRLVINKNNTEFALYMLNQGVFDAYNKNNNALKKALFNKNTDIIRALLKENNVLSGVDSDFLLRLSKEEESLLKVIKNIIYF